MANEGLKKVYAEKRERTTNLIIEAIESIQKSGKEVRRKDLIEMTGLSSGTFSQDYVKEILKEYKVCQYKNLKTIEEKREMSLVEENSKIINENNKLSSQVQTLSIDNDRLRNNVKEAEDKYKELEEEHMLLRGKFQQALEQLDAMGIKIDEIFNI